MCDQVERSGGVTWPVSPSDQETIDDPPGTRRPGLVSVRTRGAPVDTEESRTGGPGRVLSGRGRAQRERDGRAER